MSKLPSKRSELIRMAVDCARAAQDSGVYKLDGYTYHLWQHPVEDFCRVCLSGAVMAMILDADINEDLTPQNFPEECHKLEFLNSVRYGIVSASPLDNNDNLQNEATVRAHHKIRASYDFSTGLAPLDVYSEVAEDLDAAGL